MKKLFLTAKELNLETTRLPEGKHLLPNDLTVFIGAYCRNPHIENEIKVSDEIYVQGTIEPVEWVAELLHHLIEKGKKVYFITCETCAKEWKDHVMKTHPTLTAIWTICGHQPAKNKAAEIINNLITKN